MAAVGTPHPEKPVVRIATACERLEEIAHARRVLDAMDQAMKEGKGAVALDGRLIDIASIKQAENLVSKAREIAGG